MEVTAPMNFAATSSTPMRSVSHKSAMKFKLGSSEAEVSSNIAFLSSYNNIKYTFDVVYLLMNEENIWAGRITENLNQNL